MAHQTTELGLAEKGGLVESLWHAVDSVASLDNVPGLVRRIIETEAWRKRVHKGRTFEHKRFIDFITTKPLAGCGWPPEKVEALIKDDPETLTLWRESVTRANHRPKVSSDNIITSSLGTSRAYTLSRLKKQTPELFQQVVDGELSANAAAIKAGFRKKLTAFEQIQKLISKISASERRDLIQMLRDRA